MIITVNGKRIPTESIKRLLRQGERNVDAVEIRLPRDYGELDLSGLTYTLRAASRKETGAVQILDKRVEGEEVVLTWRVTAPFTAADGPLALELTGTGDQEGQVIRYTAEEIYVSPALEPVSLPEEEAAQLLAQLTGAYERAVAAAEKAEHAVGPQGPKGEQGPRGEQGPQGEKGDTGTGMRVLGRYDSLEALQTAQPDGSALDGGFLVGDYYYYWDILTSSWASAGPFYGAQAAEELEAVRQDVEELAAGLAAANTEISTKMTGAWRYYHATEQLGIARGAETMQKILDALPSKSILIYSVDTNANQGEYPWGYGVLHLVKQSPYRAYAEYVATGTSRRWFGTIVSADGGPKFNGWVELASVVKQQEFVLPLSGDYSGGWARYTKDSFGKVLLYGIAKKAGTPAPSDLIGALPAGFRPTVTVPILFATNSVYGSGASWVTYGYIGTSGAIQFCGGDLPAGYTANQNIAFNVTFMAS